MTAGPSGALPTALPMLVVAMLAACASSSVQVLARGILPYGVATSKDTIVSVELSESFELVVRDGAGTRRLGLGPAEIDLRALAVDGTTAYVGSDAGLIFEIDLVGLRQTRTFAVGAPLRALAASARYLVSADASGAVCLRRRSDGALLQCALAPIPVAAMTIDASTLWLEAHGPGGASASAPDGATVPWSLPALAPIEPTATEKLATELHWQGGTIRTSGARVIWDHGGEHRVLAQLATSIRGVAVTASGDLVVAAWPTSLEDAALLRISP